MPAFEWQTNSTRDTVQFVRWNAKYNKVNKRQSKEIKFETKVREIGRVVLIFL